MNCECQWQLMPSTGRSRLQSNSRADMFRACGRLPQLCRGLCTARSIDRHRGDTPNASRTVPLGAELVSRDNSLGQ